LRSFDHSQHGDGFGWIEAVTAKGALRFVQKATALVVAEGLHVHPGSLGDLTAT
jgi:hypothetical protein